MLHNYTNINLQHFTFDVDVYELNILPLMRIYCQQNKELKTRVAKLLESVSTTYSTSQNIECFTSFCLYLNILPESLNETNIEKFKREISKHITNRCTFNILEIIDICFGTNKLFANVTDEAWNADTHNKRGHNKIGEGEMFFSFFSGGYKPKKGDVQIEHVIPLKIEFKGTRGRLLSSREIDISENFCSVFIEQEKTIHSMAVALCALAGAIDYQDAMESLRSGVCECSSYNGTCSAITATNALNEYDVLITRIQSAWGKKTKKSSLRAICGAIQLYLYKRECMFDWLILTKKETPYICKGFQLSDSILANTLTIINNDIIIDQNLDGKGYHISF